MHHSNTATEVTIATTLQVRAADPPARSASAVERGCGDLDLPRAAPGHLRRGRAAHPEPSCVRALPRRPRRGAHAQRLVDRHHGAVRLHGHRDPPAHGRDGHLGRLRPPTPSGHPRGRHRTRRSMGPPPGPSGGRSGGRRPHRRTASASWPRWASATRPALRSTRAPGSPCGSRAAAGQVAPARRAGHGGTGPAPNRPPPRCYDTITVVTRAARRRTSGDRIER